MTIKKLKAILLGTIGLAGFQATTANADVIELALLLDGSGSLLTSGWNGQLDAYDNIFSSGTFYDDYLTNGDTLVVSAFKFAGNSVQQKIGTTTINTNSDATTFGNLFNTGVFGFQGGTTPTNAALNAGINWLNGNGIAGDKLVIDISTDGNPYPENDALSIATAGGAFTGLGIVTNAIGIGNNVSTSYLDALTTAGGGFYTVANDITAFQASLEQKLFREIQGVPAPATLALFGLGLLGFGATRRRKTA